MAIQYFILKNEDLNKEYQKEYDRYLIILPHSGGDIDPPNEPNKWLVNYDAISKFNIKNDYELK